MNKGKAIGGSFGAIIILVLSQILAQLLGSLLIILKLPAGVCNIIAGALYIGFAYVLLKIFAHKILKLDWAELGFPHFHIDLKWFLTAILLPLAVLGIFLLLPGKYIRSDMDTNEIFSTLSVGIAFTGIAAGFVEEMVFRGFILNLLKTAWNIKIGILLPSILFGAVHIIGMNFTPLSCLLVLIAGTMVGIMFSLIELENNSVWNSGIVHSIWNIIIIGGTLTVSESPDPYSIMTYVPDTKNFILTGGEFGIESSIIAVLGYSFVILMATFMIKSKKNKS